MFKDSCITKITPWSLVEESTALPVHIFPAYTGSGKCIVSLDASGLQGLNHGVQKAYRCLQDAGDMYVVRHGYIGDVISEKNLLPMGYLDWEMELDSERINCGNLSSYVSVWSRRVCIDEGKVVTKMLLKEKVWLEISVFIPFGSLSPVVEITVKGYDYRNGPVTEPRMIRLKIGMNLKTRQGKPIFDECMFKDHKMNLKVQGHEKYETSLALSCHPAIAPEYLEDWYGVTWNTSVGATIGGSKEIEDLSGDISSQSTLICMFSFDEEFSVDSLELLRSQSRNCWDIFYGNTADFEGINVREAFLFHNSLYILHSGIQPELGISIGIPFFQPWGWFASTFWDAHFIMDGLMRAGDREAADKFMGYLYKIMKKEGKPFPWMCLYDGTPTVPEERDFAPLAIAAHAMTAIKYYEYFKDRDELCKKVYPICKRVADYAIEILFSEVEGKWILAAPVSNDVVEEQASEVNQTFTMLWFLVILKKTVEYAMLLGDEHALDSRYGDILHNYYLEQDEDEYFHCRDITAEEHVWASWIPFLLYPTEGMPFIDMRLMNKTREKYCYGELYMRKQGNYQPWTKFMQALSDFRRGAPEEGQHMMKWGMEHTFGPGYFSEIGPMQETVGLPPYITAHGTYISACLYRFVTTSIWEKEIGIFSSIPVEFKNKRLAVRNITCTGNIKVSAEYNEFEAQVDIKGNLSGYRLLLPVPYGLSADEARVFVNGVQKNFKYYKIKNVMEIFIDQDSKEYEVSIM